MPSRITSVGIMSVILSGYVFSVSLLHPFSNRACIMYHMGGKGGRGGGESSEKARTHSFQKPLNFSSMALLASKPACADEALAIVPEGQLDALYNCLADVMTMKYSTRCSSTVNSRQNFLREHLKDIFFEKKKLKKLGTWEK